MLTNGDYIGLGIVFQDNSSDFSICLKKILTDFKADQVSVITYNKKTDHNEKFVFESVNDKKIEQIVQEDNFVFKFNAKLNNKAFAMQICNIIFEDIQAIMIDFSAEDFTECFYNIIECEHFLENYAKKFYEIAKYDYVS